MLQHRFAVAATSGLLLVAVAAFADDRLAARGQLVQDGRDVACAGASMPCAAEQPRSFRIGDIASPDQVHHVTKPGLYGLSDAPPGDAYAILAGELIRIDASSGKILSVLRRVGSIRD